MSGPRSIGDRLAAHRREQAEDAKAWGETHRDRRPVEEVIAGDLVGVLLVEADELGFDPVRVVQLVGLRLLEREDGASR